MNTSDPTQQLGALGANARAFTRLDRALVEPFLVASLRWCATRWSERPELLDRGLACYRYLAGRSFDQGRQGYTHLPLCVVVDLMALLELGERAPFASETQAARWTPLERRLRIDYENQLWGSLLQERAFTQARERLPQAGPARAGAMHRLAELLLQTFAREVPRWVELDPAHLRDVSLPPLQDLDVDGANARLEARVGDDMLWPELLRAMLRGISEHVTWRTLLQEEDLFELEHWAVLDTEARRIGCRQIAEVERRLGEHRLPRVRLREEVQEVEADFDDDTMYPTGGFSGLTNRGSFENLVRSELVYLGEGHPISLFDLRYVEGELLYYLRHDGVMRRRRRVVHLILDIAPLFYAKSPGYPYPFSTLAQGLVSRLTRDLLTIFEEDAVTIQAHYIARPDPNHTPAQAAAEQARCQEELSLLSLVLGRELRQGDVSITLVDTLEPAQLQQRSGRVYAIALCFDDARAAHWRATFDALARDRPPVLGLTVAIGGAQPSTEDEDELAMPLAGMHFHQIAQIKNALFAQLLGGRR